MSNRISKKALVPASARIKTQKNTTKTKKPTLKSLRKKQFDAWSPAKMFVPEPDPDNNAFSAPPVTGDYDTDQAETIRALLLWDLNEPSPVAKAKPSAPEAEKPQQPAAQKPKPLKEKPPEPEPPKKQVPVEELLAKKFDLWQPETLYVPPQDQAGEKFTAPPVTGDYDTDQAETIRALLLWDLNEPSPVAKAKPSAPQAEKPQQPVAQKPEPPKENHPGPEAEKEQKPGAAAGPEKPEKAEASEKSASKKDSDSPDGGGAAGPPGGEPPEPPKPPVAEKKRPPLDPKRMGLIAIVGLLFVLIIMASFNNADNYYLRQTDTALEIWKGKFSPRGQEKILTLPGRQAPETQKEIYSKQEALTPAFDYYMDRADALSEAQDLIDFQAIRENLEKAKQYATTNPQKQRVNRRVEHMDLLMLLFKADVAAEKQTLQSLKNAIAFLDQAAALDISEQARRVLEDRMAAVREAADALKEKAAAEKAAKAEKAAEATSEEKQAGENQQQDMQPAPEPNRDAAETTDKETDKNLDKPSGKDAQDSDDPGTQAESEPQ